MGGARGIIFGIKRGIVVFNQDPEFRNRVKVRVPGLHDNDVDPEDLPWAGVMYVGMGQGQGKLEAPKKGISVVIQFIEGDPDHPMVLGEWPTTLDVVNTSKVSYTAGESKSVVEGNEDKRVYGDSFAGTQLNKRVTVGRDFIQNDRNHTVTTSGKRVIEASAEEVTLYGPLTQKVEGVIEVIGGASVSLASILGMSISAGGSLDLLSLAGALNLTSAALGVTIRNGLLGYIQITPAGVILMGTNETTSALLRPVTTIEHIHIGNLGLPTSPALPGPTLGGISTKLLVE